MMFIRPRLPSFVASRHLPMRIRAVRIEGCLYCKACGDYTYQPGYGCLACGFVEPGV